MCIGTIHSGYHNPLINENFRKIIPFRLTLTIDGISFGRLYGLTMTWTFFANYRFKNSRDFNLHNKINQLGTWILGTKTEREILLNTRGKKEAGKHFLHSEQEKLKK
jgi:hypothetical protein